MKRSVKYGLMGAGVLGTALLLSQCFNDENEAPAYWPPPAPNEPVLTNPYFSTDMSINMRSQPDSDSGYLIGIIGTGSCVQALRNLPDDREASGEFITSGEFMLVRIDATPSGGPMREGWVLKHQMKRPEENLTNLPVTENNCTGTLLSSAQP